MAFYDFDQNRGGFILAKREILFVPDFKALYDGFGWDAIQYLFYFSAKLSPFNQMSDLAQRDKKCRDAIEKDSWEQGRKLPARFFENPVFQIAQKTFDRDYDDWIEGKQETMLHRMRMDALNRIEALDITKAPDRKEIGELLDIVDTLSKQHRDSKKALADRLATDDQVAVTTFDV